MEYQIGLKNPMQSSTHSSPWSAEMAINKDDSKCTHTCTDAGNCIDGEPTLTGGYWEATFFEGSHTVTQVELLNRPDCC